MIFHIHIFRTLLCAVIPLTTLIPNWDPWLKQLRKSEKDGKVLGAAVHKGDRILGVSTSVDTAVKDIAADESVQTAAESAKTDDPSAMKECYRALKTLLLDAKKPPTTEDGETLNDLLKTTIVRLVHKERGTVHWVARSHLNDKLKRQAFIKKGYTWVDAVTQHGSDGKFEQNIFIDSKRGLSRTDSSPSTRSSRNLTISTDSKIAQTQRGLAPSVRRQVSSSNSEFDAHSPLSDIPI